MEYIEINFEVSPLQPNVDILIAELGYIGFESFVETAYGVTAYIQKPDYKDSLLDEVNILKSSEFQISYSIKTIAQTNWNEEWEKSFEPIEIGDRCHVRAPFHSQKPCDYDIVIEPKMSFGTGHHETTLMMLQFILDHDFKNKAVLDMGCGTGVLAILASKKGASSLDAIDIDNWCYENSIENVNRNECNNINVQEGDASLLLNQKYDCVLANINRNILLNDLKTYVNCLNNRGSLFLSGFYNVDIPIIEAACNALNLKLQAKQEQKNWVALKFVNS
jgi:ribosomal protein L11 methyltransferase